MHFYILSSLRDVHLVPITPLDGQFDARHTQIATRWTWRLNPGRTLACNERREDVVRIMHRDLWVKLSPPVVLSPVAGSLFTESLKGFEELFHRAMNHL